MDQQTFRLLLEKYLTDQATEGERQVLFQRLRRGFDSNWAALIDEYFADPIFETVTSPRLQDDIRTRLLDAIRQLPEESKTPVRRLFPRRWAAAAAVLILMTGASLYLFRTHPSTPSNSSHPVQDVAPGGSKAILTLSNGQQIILDSAKNGILALQNNTQVNKLTNGELAYSPLRGGQNLIAYNTLSTPRGGFYELKLPDGTKVWLNAASSITYPTAFTGKERLIELTGEAYFEVVHNDKLPFRVKTAGQTIEDIGTAFNINAYPDEQVVRTTLIEGAVKLSLPTSPDKGIRLKPGEQAKLTGNKFKIAEGVDIEQVVAWKNGQISFANVDFAALMRQISRWYDVDIHYSGAVPQRQFFGLLSRSVYLSTILEYFKENGIRMKQEGKTITVLP